MNVKSLTWDELVKAQELVAKTKQAEKESFDAVLFNHDDGLDYLSSAGLDEAVIIEEAQTSSMFIVQWPSLWSDKPARELAVMLSDRVPKGQAYAWRNTLKADFGCTF